MTAGVLNTFRYLSPAYIADKGPAVSYLDGILSIVLLLLVATVLLGFGPPLGAHPRRSGATGVDEIAPWPRPDARATAESAPPGA